MRDVPTKPVHVGLDSQCFSYLIDAMSRTQTPTDSLANQRIALLRTFLYRRGGLSLTPTVRKEFGRIRALGRAEFHDEWTMLFGETQPISSSGIDARTENLLRFHRDEDDCRIVAEAEDAGLAVLLTFDANLISRLSTRTVVALVRPLEYWEDLGIPRGATPVTVPRADNPMSAQQWWRWV